MDKTKFDFIRNKSLAKELGVSEKTLNNWYQKGILDKYIIGGCVFFKTSQIKEALIELRQNKQDSSINNKKN